MSARSFTIETRTQAAVIVSAPGPLAEKIADTIKKIDAEVIRVIPDENLSAAVQKISAAEAASDIDYCLVLYSGRLAQWLGGEGREVFVHLAAARLVVIARVGDRTSVVSLFPSARICLLGDYLGNTYAEADELERMVGDALRDHRLVLPGDGVAEYSLTADVDVVNATIRALISPTWGKDPLTIANPSTVSLLSLAYQIRSALPFKIAISFNESTNWQDYDYDWEQILEEQTKAGVTVASPVESLVLDYLHSATIPARLSPLPPAAPKEPERALAPHKITPPKEAVLEKLPPKPPRPRVEFVKIETEDSVKARLEKILGRQKPARRVTAHPVRSIIIKSLVIAVCLYLASLACAATITVLGARALVQSFSGGQLPNMRSIPVSRVAATYLEANAVALQSTPGVGQNEAVNTGVLLLDGYNQALAALTVAGTVEQSSEKIGKYVLADADGDIAGDISAARLGVEDLYQRLSLLDGSLPATPPPVLGKYGARYTSVKTELATAKRSVLTVKALLATAPDLIGLGGRREYAILFENNMELRATGGFIGSFAIATFDNGHLIDMPVTDVYAADGQLKGHVEPPVPIKDVLGEANWYLRDSNFDPDFPTTATRAEWFIQKELNQETSGAAAVTLSTLQDVLKATGPLSIPDYNETVTADNIFERAESHAETNFFPGSTQKKEYLSAVADALFSKLRGASGLDTLKILAALANSITEKNTLLTIDDPATSQVLSQLGWNGELVDQPCPGSGNCIKDYLMVVDSNFGVNKANYYLSRKIAVDTTIDGHREIQHVVHIAYTNSATSSSWPAGAYKDYQRLYVPLGATINSITVGDTTLTQKDFTVGVEHNRTVIGYVVNVPVNTTVLVTADYASGLTLPSVNPEYTWYWQKQPGTSANDPLTVSVNYPLFMKPVVISPSATANTQQLQFDLQNDTDRRVTTQFE